jgi:hypothetical protein
MKYDGINGRFAAVVGVSACEIKQSIDPKSLQQLELQTFLDNRWATRVGIASFLSAKYLYVFTFNAYQAEQSRTK